MACSLPHTDSEVEALVQRLINKDKGRQDALLNLAFQFEDSCPVRDDLRKPYEKCNDISQESRALICTLLKESSDKDHKLHLSMYGKAAQLERQMGAKLAWFQDKSQLKISRAKAEAARCKGYRSPVLSQRRRVLRVFNDIECDKNVSNVEGRIWIRDLYMTGVGDSCVQDKNYSSVRDMYRIRTTIYGLSTHKFASMALPDHVIDVIDNDAFVLQSKEANAMKGVECLAATIKIEVLCSVDSPPQRMKIEIVVIELQRILDMALDIIMSCWHRTVSPSSAADVDHEALNG
ncbi:hypothetical protein Tco_1351251 [Tanacetum coccineum]